MGTTSVKKAHIRRISNQAEDFSPQGSSPLSDTEILDINSTWKREKKDHVSIYPIQTGPIALPLENFPNWMGD